MWAAFGHFCHTRIGVGPETMPRACQFRLDDFLATSEHYEKMKPDPKKVKECVGYITKHCDGRFRPKRPGDEYVTYDSGTEGGPTMRYAAARSFVFLTSPECFSLMVEALARGDKADADRQE